MKLKVIIHEAEKGGLWASAQITKQAGIEQGIQMLPFAAKVFPNPSAGYAHLRLKELILRRYS
ncbi:MAG: hypothetical protein H0X70_02310 [Segetibacter sp.]|jgi:hypothetical protein|nr:hypothetical protein [Segetibacter sp.]